MYCTAIGEGVQYDDWLTDDCNTTELLFHEHYITQQNLLTHKLGKYSSSQTIYQKIVLKGWKLVLEK